MIILSHLILQHYLKGTILIMPIKQIQMRKLRISGIE